MAKKKAKGKGKAPARAKARKTAPKDKAPKRPHARAAKPAKARDTKARPPAAEPAKTPARGAGPAAAAGQKPALPAPKPKKSGRRSTLSQRRGPDGQLFVPGDLLLPGGAQSPDEVHYFLRGVAAAEHPAVADGVAEILTKRGSEADRPEIDKTAEAMRQRFGGGSIEPLLPARPQLNRRTFQSVVERVKHRRREIGAFLRGLDLGRTETSHMDSHGEASLDSLMKWAAHLENLAEADEPEGGDFTQHHRFLDNLENSTEALIIDIEQTLRRLRDRIRPS